MFAAVKAKGISNKTHIFDGLVMVLITKVKAAIIVCIAGRYTKIKTC